MESAQTADEGLPFSAAMMATRGPAEGVAQDSREQDARLVAAAQRNAAAFAALYERYMLPVYRYFYHRVGNTHDAEDLTGQTFSKALGSLSRYRATGSFAAWLFGIARHTLLDYRRGWRPEADVAEIADALVDPDRQPDEQVLRAEQLAALGHMVRRLDDDQREVVLLRLFAELSTRDVAEIIGKSEAAVKMLLHRAVLNLRARYSEEAQ